MGCELPLPAFQPPPGWFIIFFTRIDLFDKTSELLPRGGPSHDVIIKTIYYSILHQDVYAYTHIYIYIYLCDIFLHIFCVAFLLNPSDPLTLAFCHPFRTELVELWLTLEVAATASVVEVVSFASRAVPMENGLSPSHVMMNVQVGGFQKDGMMWKMEVFFADLFSQKNIFWKKGCLKMVQYLLVWMYKYWFPGFGFDSGPNLQPWWRIENQGVYMFKKGAGSQTYVCCRYAYDAGLWQPTTPTQWNNP